MGSGIERVKRVASVCGVGGWFVVEILVREAWH